MRGFVLLIVVLLSFGSSAFAQFREGGPPKGIGVTSGITGAMAGIADTITADLTPGAGEKILYLTGATLGFALFDYVGFNLVRGNNVMLPVYRVLQGLVQAGVSWFLYRKLGLPTTIAFNVLWWTWGMDAVYYGYTELFNVGGSWNGRGTFRAEILDNNCTWASWTPVGIARGMDPDKKIAGDTLIAQSLVGAALALTITLTF
ncbi:MAG: hypothetical protein JXA28_10725 [Bacteroidetes bacterium]|nr:hypothetical protein [Bacteroidota bacterium]